MLPIFAEIALAVLNLLQLVLLLVIQRRLEGARSTIGRLVRERKHNI